VMPLILSLDSMRQEG